MNLENLKEEVLEANLELVKKNLVISTWGNVSGYDRERSLMVIKASGIKYKEMKKEHMVVVDLNGNALEGRYAPSTDTKTHIVLYKAFDNICGITHTHSQFATMWAQSGKSIPCYGTTHADYFYGDIPITRLLKDEEIKDEYEENTGHVIVETIKEANKMNGVLVQSHGPFTWGKSPYEAVLHSEVLEYIAKMAFCNEIFQGKKIQNTLLKKHYERKFGENSYYGQKDK